MSSMSFVLLVWSYGVFSALTVFAIVKFSQNRTLGQGLD